MKVDLIDHMGSDLTVVNAARVSMDKESDWKQWGWKSEIKALNDADTKLIKYLAKHQHWTPFAHPQVSFRVKAPLFVRSQLFKSTVGLVANEVSRRYVSTEPEFYEPDVWRKKAENVKQGSSDDVFNHPDLLWMQNHIKGLKTMYLKLVEEGCCPEQARMVLPQSMYTEWVWTGSLAAFSRVCKLRLDPHTQQETQRIAELISAYMADLFPVSWEVLQDD